MKPTIFISCGQFTAEEKLLGKQIAALVKKITNHEPYFAEEVQDLNGLDENVLSALKACSALIVVLHPRGRIDRPDGTTFTRASVWIEQEIAIAAYIQRVEKRTLPILAFKHTSVDREGLRDFVILNPTEFDDEAEVLAELAVRLQPWKALSTAKVELVLRSAVKGIQENHMISNLQLDLVNETNDLISSYQLELQIPAGLLKHWNSSYGGEVPGDDARFRYFRRNQRDFGPALPHSTLALCRYDYCTKCSADSHEGLTALVAESKFRARIWIQGREYLVEKSVEQLALERERNT